MKLNKETKNDVKIGDVLRFDYGDAYRVVTVIAYTRGIAYTLRDVKSGRTIYAYPASQCYGAEIVKA